MTLDIMDWNFCVKEFIKKVEPDPDKINSLIRTAELRFKHVSSIAADKNNVSFIIEGYYEIIKELLTALLLSYGLRSKNHQCLVSFLYTQFKDYEAEVNLISQLCFLRNRLDYYDETIDFGFYEKNKQDIVRVISLLKKMIKP